MVTALQRKLLRDLWRQRGQVISIAALVGCGVMAIVGMRSTYDSLAAALDDYYERYRFADVFATLTRAPDAVTRRIRAIEGVAAVQTRVTAQATLAVPGLAGAAIGQLVSVPSVHEPMLNDLHLFRGRYIAAARDDEVVASVRFAASNDLDIGDTLSAVINGRWQRLRIVGIASAPDFLYEIAGATFFVDSRRFGVLWMRREALAAAAGMSGGFNSVALTLTRGASEDRVKADLDRLLARYGGVGSIGRELQPSAQVLVDELHQVSGTATVFPLFFLGIAAFLLNVVLSRLIATQRDEIGTLKAFGYSDRVVGMHYLAFAFTAVLLGAVLGVLGGMWLGRAFTGLYDDYFGFPNLVHRTRWLTGLVGIGVSGGAALAGALWAVRSAVTLPPAEAMRPASPARYRPMLLERIGLARFASPGARMVLRTLERRPVRTAASIVGISLACAVLVAGIYPFDAVDRLIDVNFKLAQREDLSLAFTAPRAGDVRFELASVPGVARVELTRATAARIRHAHHVRSIAVQGIEQDGRLRRLVDATGAAHELPSCGLVVSRSLADALGVGIADTVRLELLERGISKSAVVAGVTEESIGLAAYMERRALNRLLNEGDVASGAALSVVGGEGRVNDVADALRARPGVSGISSRAALIEYFERTFAESVLLSGSVVIFAAVVIAVGVMYNSARVSLSERARELASLRVLGFTRREVSRFFLGEQGIITLSGLPLGAIVGLGFAALLAMAFSSERHRFPVLVERTTYLFAVAVVLLTAALVAFTVRRRLDRLDLIATLKTGD